MRRFTSLALLLVFLPAPELPADSRCSGSIGMSVFAESDDGLNPAKCSGNWCQMPTAEEATYSVISPSCNPSTTNCAMEATVSAHFVANSNNYPSPSQSAYATIKLVNSTGSVVETCGFPTASINSDLMTAKVPLTISCNSPSDGKFRLQFIACDLFSCRNVVEVPLDFKAGAGCRLPAMHACGAGECCLGPLNSAPAIGSSPAAEGSDPMGEALASNPTVDAPGVSFQLPGSGPAGFSLAYLYSGAGGPGYPEAPAFGRPMGSSWSHPFALRIVTAPDQTKVWLITADGSYRKFESLDSANFYQTALPSDEKRELQWLGAGQGWLLYGFDGSQVRFRPDGLWSTFVDPHGLETTGTYDAAPRLTGVAFPDGRSLTLAYGAGGASRP